MSENRSSGARRCTVDNRSSVASQSDCVVRRKAPFRLLTGPRISAFPADHPQADSELEPRQLNGPGLANMKGGFVVQWLGALQLIVAIAESQARRRYE